MTYSLLSLLTHLPGESISRRFVEVNNLLLEVKSSKKYGSGFLLTQDGYALTAYHVVKENIPYSASINRSGFDISVKDVCCYDDSSDIALIRLDLDIAKSPFPVYFSDNYKIPHCSMSSRSSEKRYGRFKSEDDFVYSTCLAAPGWSGSPIVSRNGYVIGIVLGGRCYGTYFTPFSKIEDLILKYIAKKATS